MTRLLCSARPDGGHRGPRILRVASTALALGSFSAACSSNTAATSTSTSTSAPASTTSAPSTTVPAKVAADIGKAYKTLFDLANPQIGPKLSATQDGATLKGAFASALKSPLAKQAGGARVHSVTIEAKSACTAANLPYPCAKVVYDVLNPAGQLVLPNAKGSAVELNGRWLVSKTTICTLLVLANGGQTPVGC